MLGLMMDVPLLVSGIIEHAANVHRATEVVSRSVGGAIRRYNYGEAAARCRRLARALISLGVREGDRIGSLAWNTRSHFELFYGVPGFGAVLHTINPRLHDDQIAYIVNHAEDSWIFVDAATLPIAERIARRVPTVKGWIFMGEGEPTPATDLPNFLDMDALLADCPPDFDWPRLDERRACTICYTSGTTGSPKGVVYSHRSTVLSALFMSMADMIGGYRSGEQETVMPIAPLFHANGWQMPYTAPLNGHRLVLPGRSFEPEKLLEIMEGEKVSVAAAVPTVWLSLLDLMDKEDRRLPALRAAMVAGTKAPRSLVERLERHQITIGQTWGMTEAPGVLRTTMPPGMASAAPEEQMTCKLRQGRIGFGAELRLVDEAGETLPNDGQSVGQLEVRGFAVAASYYKQPGPVRDGWLATGDVARIFPDGTVEIVDRSKDVIKSGGEWISSAELESVALGHPAILQAAVIGVAHPKWQERPLLIAVARPGATVTGADLLAHIARSVSRWWVPDAVVFVEKLPTTATGKVQKAPLREQYGHLQAADGTSMFSTG